MTYGGQNAAQMEAQARDELFAGATPGGGPGVASGRALAKEDLQYMDSRQILDHAVDQHKETTATAKRALQVVEQTKELQVSTITALQDQGRQMGRIAQGMDKIGTDLTYSQRILRYMRMCCCIGFFCSCCTEPERETSDRNWRPSYAGPPPPNQPGSVPRQQQAARGRGRAAAGAGAAAGPSEGASYPGVTTQGLEAAGYGGEAAAIQKETAQQDEYLDQIAQGLDQLKHGALAMQDEISRQDQHVNRLTGDAHVLHGKLREVNRAGFKF